MKRIVSIIALCAAALGLLCGCGGSGGSGEAVSVMSVGLITGTGAVGTAEVFAGKVVSGATAELKRDADKTVLEVLVAEGDMVRAGDVLFSYDTEAMRLSLDKLVLELESLQNSITAARSQIRDLETQRSKASSDQQLSYTLEISAREADIREAEYNIALKEKEIEAMEASMENTEVTSPISGRVMSVGDPDGANPNAGGESEAFVTVMDVSAYRVQGNISELNRYSLAEGTRVLVRSRMDDALVWYGVVSLIDWENPVTNTGDNYYYYGGVDEMTSSSKYPFYVTLDSTEGLLLGEHVYIETDIGGAADTPGLMLPAWYVVDDAYVWAANAKGRLEKRSVTLGASDELQGTVEIMSGLGADDYVAFPDETLSEGLEVVYYDEESFGGDGEYYDGEYYGGEYYDGEYYDGEYYDEAYTGGDYYGEESYGGEVYYADDYEADGGLIYDAGDVYDDGAAGGVAVVG